MAQTSFLISLPKKGEKGKKKKKRKERKPPKW
jgi:hypothetical protein